MKKLGYAMLLTLVFVATVPLAAGELEGIKMPDKITVGGKDLTLNGMGLRTKYMFNVYVAGLYLETPNKNADAILTSEQVRRVDMVMKRDLGREKIIEAVDAGFEKNNKAQMGALKARLDRFTAGIIDLKEGDHLVINYEPGKGVTLQTQDGKTIVVEGKDFADALFSVWLGKFPVDEDLKKGMLGL
jgi:hypothetical protein